MRKLLIFALALIPLVTNAQNTSSNAQPAQFTGSYSFTDANGTAGIVTINTPSITKKDYNGDLDYYAGTGTCVFGEETHYFKWQKYVGRDNSDYIEMEFSLADYPAFTVKGKSYKTERPSVTGNRTSFFIKNGWLYYDGIALEADNPKLRFKLNKK